MNDVIELATALKRQKQLLMSSISNLGGRESLQIAVNNFEWVNSRVQKGFFKEKMIDKPESIYCEIRKTYRWQHFLIGNYTWSRSIDEKSHLCVPHMGAIILLESCNAWSWRWDKCMVAILVWHNYLFIMVLS